MVFTDDILLVNMIKGVRPKFIDLGLPSGTLWADCNMGANQAVSMGNYYAWGETRSSANGKTNFGWNDYRYANGSNNKLTKYCTKSVYGNNGFTDNLTELQGSDDPASDNWGYWYSIPTKEEWEELVNYCDWKWIYGGTYSNGVYISSRKNDEHINLGIVSTVLDIHFLANIELSSHFDSPKSPTSTMVAPEPCTFGTSPFHFSIFLFSISFSESESEIILFAAASLSASIFLASALP